MKEHNEKKAKILYDFLDQSKLFKGTVRKEDRSLMNVPFVTGDKELDAKFVKEAKAAGFVNLKGHRTVGGMRASIYNAMPIEGVEKLVEFMREFEEKNSNQKFDRYRKRIMYQYHCLNPISGKWAGSVYRQITSKWIISTEADGCAGAQRSHARDGAAGEPAGHGQSRSRRQQYSRWTNAPSRESWYSTPRAPTPTA